MRRLETHTWWPELVALKDERSLRQLAEQFGVTPGAIVSALKRQKIERTHARSGPRKDLDSDGLLKKNHRLAAFGDLLGAVPDSDIAKRAGVSVRTVANYRREHGIERRESMVMQWGWQVTFEDGLSRVLFAANANEVLLKMGPLGVLTGMERLAPAWQQHPVLPADNLDVDNDEGPEGTGER